METFAAIRTVLAVRAYQDKPIPPKTVRRIVEAGHLTGSSMNKQPWHFIVIQDPDMLQRLGSIARSGTYIAQAPLAIIVAVEKQSRFGVSDGSRAIQSMMLAAWAEGVGSNWVGFIGFEEVKEWLAIPQDLDILAILPFGYPLQAVGQGKKRRKPLGEIAHSERFGQPFS